VNDLVSWRIIAEPRPEFQKYPGIGRASYVVEDGVIRYTASTGEQVWKLVSIDENSLHVDNRGAEMFFERE
jgi:hypothetical protein